MLPAMSERSERIVVPASDERRRRFPGIGDGWARFDGPAGTQMVDRAIDAAATWSASGNNANSGGAFAAADACDELLDRTRRTRRAAARRRSRRHRLRRQHDHADVRLHPRRGRDAAARRPRRRHPPRPRRQRHAVAPRRATGPAPSRCSRRSTRPPAGSIPPRSIDLIDERTRWVAVTGASNLIGTIARPGADRRRRPRRSGARVFVDAVHLAPHRRIDVAALGCDVLVTAPYKWYGPHAGVLCADPALLDALPVGQGPSGPRHRAPPLGDRARRTSRRSPRSPPPPSSCSRRASTGSAPTRRGVRARCSTGSATIAGVRVWGPPTMEDRTPTVAFTVDGQHPDDVAAALAAATDRDVGRALRTPSRSSTSSGSPTRVASCASASSPTSTTTTSTACSPRSRALRADADQVDGGVDAGEHARRRGSR